MRPRNPEHALDEAAADAVAWSGFDFWRSGCVDRDSPQRDAVFPTRSLTVRAASAGGIVAERRLCQHAALCPCGCQPGKDARWFYDCRPVGRAARLADRPREDVGGAVFPLVRILAANSSDRVR